MIDRNSILAIDVMSIFFLFCSAKDYSSFGSERLIIALVRISMNNQAKVLNNILRKLSDEERILHKDVLQYFIYQYKYPVTASVHDFWKLIHPDALEIMQEEFRENQTVSGICN